MEAQEIARYVQTASKKTPMKVCLNVTEPIKFKDNKVFGEGNDFVIFDDYGSITPALEAEVEKVTEIEVETAVRYSVIPLLNIEKINAHTELGTIIRDQVSIGNNTAIMVGAIINASAVVSENTMIGIGTVLGGRATVGKDCHISTGAVLMGVIEPAPAKPVIVEDGALIGVNAVIVEGVHIGKDAVVVARAVVLEDVSTSTVVGGISARVLKISDGQAKENTALTAALREL